MISALWFKRHIQSASPALKRFIHIFLCFGASFSILFVFSLLLTPEKFYFDSYNYWNLGESFSPDGIGFSLLNFPQSFRGYFYPLLLYCYSQLGSALKDDPVFGFQLGNSLLHALLCGFLLPALLAGKAGWIKRLSVSILFSFLLIYFWRFTLMYPLTDGPAFILLCVAVIAFKNGTGLIFQEAPSRIRAVGCFASAGAFSYAAYNTRTIYLFSLIFICIIFLINLFRKMGTKAKLAGIGCGLAALCLGALIVAVPQGMINKHTFGEFSLAVNTEKHSATEMSLFASQLNWGLVMDRFEGYVGHDPGQYQAAGVMYLDNGGSILLQKYAYDIGAENGLIPIETYFKLLFERPLDICAVYMRHLINLLTPLYPEVYIKDLVYNKQPIFIVNFIFWTLGILSMLQKKSKAAKLNLRDAVWSSDIPYSLALIIPCIFIIPGAPEARFFMPAHMMLYAMLGFKTDFPAVLQMFKKHFISISIGIIILLAFWLSIITSTLSHTQQGVIFVLS